MWVVTYMVFCILWALDEDPRTRFGDRLHVVMLILVFLLVVILCVIFIDNTYDDED